MLVWNFEVFIHGCHISVKCNIPKSTVLPHPIGIVVGDGVIVEEGVTIYQNVTIGVRNLKSNQYPYVGEGSVIYSGAVIAGEVVLRPKAVIPANSFIKG